MEPTSPSAKQAIWLVDDNEELRTVVSAAFHEVKSHTIECFESAEVAIQFAKETSDDPAVILLDIELPRMNGIDAIEHFKKLLPRTKILILSNFDNDPYVDQAFAKGANGYLLKPFKVEEVISAVEASLRNEMPVSPRVMKKVADLVLLVHPLARDYGLGDVEIETLRWKTNGLRNKRLAEEMNIGVKTVKAHLTSIYKKLGVRSETEAVAKVLRERLLAPGVH